MFKGIYLTLRFRYNASGSLKWAVYGQLEFGSELNKLAWASSITKWTKFELTQAWFVYTPSSNGCDSSRLGWVEGKP